MMDCHVALLLAMTLLDCHVATLLAKTFGWWIAASLRFSQRRLCGGLPRCGASSNEVGELHIALKLLYFLCDFFMLGNFSL